MRPDSARSLMAAAALLAIAATAGCSDTGTGPEAGSPAEETTSSSSRVVPPPTAPSPPPSPSTPPPRASPTPPGPLVASATWADSDFGVTLKVAPTAAGREAWGALDADAAWQEVLRLAPDAGTPGMREQFDCHWTWARLLEPGKPTWNLEPWRPVVADEQMLAEGCNPGGPEV
ncbi:MAG: DUF2599 domain-containing protein [Dietzia sp.]